MRAGRRARGTPAAAALAAVALAAGPAAGQGLASYDYDNLGFRGIGAEVGYVDARGLDDAVTVGVRVDLGYLGPQVRVMPRFAYWSSDVQTDEVAALARRIEELVDLPPGSLDLGAVERRAFVFGADVQWAPGLALLSPYLGLGADLYVLDGSGEAIQGTFVESALDLVTAGVSAVGGLEASLGRNLRAYGELRATLVTDVRNLALVGGLMVTTGR